MYDYGFFKCRWDGWSSQLLPDARNDFNRSVLSFFSLRGISVDTKNPDNVGIWALFLLQVDQPTDYAYCVAGEDDMVGIYVDLPAEQFDYEVTG
ncbi:MAG: hypothetical protein ACLTCV_06680 [Oscillospiraceae bacterium]